MAENDLNERTFLLKEYESLRCQIDHITKELINLERLSLIASGLIWSWLATTSKQGLPALIYWAPAIISVLFGLRAFGLHLSNMKAGQYILDIEKYFKLPNGYGWEHLLSTKRPFWVLWAAVLYWVVMILVNIAIPIFYIPNIPNMK